MLNVITIIGFYGSVKLTNKYEVPASFSWKPSEEDSKENATFYPQHSSGEACKLLHSSQNEWSMNRSACLSDIILTGVIAANNTLECEFIYHAAYDHPDSAVFNLLLDGGKSETIKCIAKVLCNVCENTISFMCNNYYQSTRNQCVSFLINVFYWGIFH